MSKKKRPDDEPMPEDLNEQAERLEEEAPPAAPDPDYVNPETVVLDGEDDTTPAESTEPEQQPLFGKADEIINVLETEKISVQALIDRAFDVILKKKGEIFLLEKRKKDIEKAIETLRQPGVSIEPDPGPLFSGSDLTSVSEPGAAEAVQESPEEARL